MDPLKFQPGGDTLVLNSDGLPVSMVPISTMNWRDSVKSAFLGSVEVLHHYDNWIVRSPSVEFKVPSVIMIKEWVKTGRFVKFNKHNIFIRDRYTCQYCGERFNSEDLTMDHVIPRIDGGKTNWTNITSSCGPCNHTKSHFYKMKPTRYPWRPSYGEFVNILKEREITIRDEAWNYYLGWPEEKIKVISRKNFEFK